MTDLGKLKSAGVAPFMFTDGNANCTPSWWARRPPRCFASQVSQFDVNHAQVTNGLDVAVGIHKGIIGMSNPRYAEAWKLLGQLISYSASGESGYDGCADPNATSPPLSPRCLLIQGKVGVLGRKLVPIRGSGWASLASSACSPSRPSPRHRLRHSRSEPPRSGSSAARTATASGASPPSARTGLRSGAREDLPRHRRAAIGDSRRRRSRGGFARGHHRAGPGLGHFDLYTSHRQVPG